METLAYLHHACANEAPDELPTLSASQFLNGLKLSGTAYPKILSVLMGLLILSTASAAMALQRGDRGPEVTNLQRQLTAVGCYSGPITDFFGTLTEQGVIECQRRFGLRQDGIAGPATLNAIARGTGGPSSPVPNNGLLRLGSRGQAVANVQSRLSQLRLYSGPIDGVFGPGTQAAVIRFQRERGLFTDGVVGPDVYRELSVAVFPNNPGPAPSGLAAGASGAAVEQLQQRLRNLGYFNEGVTGYYGNVTRDSVARFQRDNGLPTTGSADARTLGLLGFSVGSDFYSTNPYVVIIPKQSSSTLAQVQRLVPGAFLAPSRLGDYIQVGAYPTLESANTQSNILRARGLDARVTYSGN